MLSEINDFSKLCIHTITTKPWKLEEAVEQYTKAGVRGITIWRDALEGRNVYQSGELIRSAGLEVVSLCRGGFFPSTSTKKRLAAVDENLSIIDEAAALGAPHVVLVCGADAAQPLETSREQIKEGILKVLPHAQKCGIKLVIEPLHPMYADNRSAMNTLKQANDMAEEIFSDFVGVAVDVYHLWWESDLENEIIRCGKNDNLFAFHVCDWKTPTSDLLNDRGLMGEGCIDVPKIRSWVEHAGFKGFNEVEIFSTNYWGLDQKIFLDKILKAYLNHT